MAGSAKRVIVYWKAFLLCWLGLAAVACTEKPQSSDAQSAEVHEGNAPEWRSHKRSGYEVVRELPHDAKAYTQGLLLLDGDWIESTGGHGTSSIRRVKKETGEVLIKKELERSVFGEGVAVLDDKLYQLTWKSRNGFIYDTKNLQKLGSFSYNGEGWGMTTDGKSLIMSDGSDRLRFLHPKTFRVLREISVKLEGKPVRMLNELEFIEGEIFANVWHTDEIVRINPVDGSVVGIIDLAGIYPDAGKLHPEFVLNGIAYDAAAKKLFVTGKCWPKIYEIRLVKVK